LPHRIVLAEELHGLIARSIYPGLQPAHQPEAVFQADQRAPVEAEQAAGKIAEAWIVKGSRKPVRDPEGAFVSRQAKRRREIDNREIRFREIELAIRASRGSTVVGVEAASCGYAAAVDTNANSKESRRGRKEKPIVFRIGAIVSLRLFRTQPRAHKTSNERVIETRSIIFMRRRTGKGGAANYAQTQPTIRG
jgi:hypothetical protein